MDFDLDLAQSTSVDSQWIDFRESPEERQVTTVVLSSSNLVSCKIILGHVLTISMVWDAPTCGHFTNASL